MYCISIMNKKNKAAQAAAGNLLQALGAAGGGATATSAVERRARRDGAAHVFAVHVGGAVLSHTPSVHVRVAVEPV